MSRAFSRRTALRGLGVTLALPWLETLAPRAASAQLAPIKRYVALYFPNGAADFWTPRLAGEGSAWSLSPILEPLAAVKPYVSVLSDVSNYAPFGGHVEPSHSNLGASTWTCVRPSGQGNEDNGISVDQVIANHIGGATLLPSLQVGLSTLDSSTDGLPGQHSRSMAWKSATQPLYKIVNPQAVFDRLVSGIPASNEAGPDPEAERRRALQKSALDYVLEAAGDLQKKLSTSDRSRLDDYMTAVRSLELRVADPSMAVGTPACMPPERPGDSYAVGNVPQGYNRGAHAALMLDLVLLAFRCDITRVVSFMLDDARSDFVYDFVNERDFTDDGSTETDRRTGGYHGLQHAGDRNNGFATIGWWNAQKAAELAAGMIAIEESDGSNALDHGVITFLSGMKGGNHDAREVRLVQLGSGGGVLKTDQHLDFGQETRLADVHLTVLKEVFGCPETSFGASSGILPELLS